jgi:hypothetical protein
MIWLIVASSNSMKLKIIDLGNAIPKEHTNIYYDDFEVQSIHYRAPEVFAQPFDLIVGTAWTAIHFRY